MKITSFFFTCLFCHLFGCCCCCSCRQSESGPREGARKRGAVFQTKLTNIKGTCGTCKCLKRTVKQNVGHITNMWLLGFVSMCIAISNVSNVDAVFSYFLLFCSCCCWFGFWSGFFVCVDRSKWKFSAAMGMSLKPAISIYARHTYDWCSAKKRDRCSGIQHAAGKPAIPPA